MENVMNVQVATQVATPTLHLGTYRRAIMAVLSAEVFTPAERVLANHNTYECEDAARLALWLKNVRRVATEREAVAEAQALTNLAQGIERFEGKLVEYATAEQKREIVTLGNSVWILRKEKTRALLQLPHLNQPQATLLIGELWAKVLHRQERAAEGHADANESFSSAA